MGAIKIVAISFIVVFCIITYIINEKFRNNIFKFLNKRIFKTKLLIKNVLNIIIAIILLVLSVKALIVVKKNIDFMNEDISDQLETIRKSEEIIQAQNLKYNELMETETNIENCKNPYIPDNFKYVEGEWNTGFVIEDEDKNQFVWIPCTNIENSENIPILEKKVFIGENKIYSNCYEQNDFEEFIKSSLKFGGFYISRYEIGNENDKPVSKKDVKVWTSVTWKKAKELSENMYSNINSRLINGYAFDTAVSYIYNDVKFSDISRSTGFTGTRSYKNIYDLVDDCNEWTTEMRYESPLLRANIFKEDENTIMFFVDRFAGDDKTVLTNLGFRTIIYK